MLTGSHNQCFERTISTNMSTTVNPSLTIRKRSIRGLNYMGVSNYENMSMQFTAIFHGSKNEKKIDKTIDNFLIFAQNIDCGYMLEPPQ